jgi:hypothetical protein
MGTGGGGSVPEPNPGVFKQQKLIESQAATPNGLEPLAPCEVGAGTLAADATPAPQLSFAAAGAVASSGAAVQKLQGAGNPALPPLASVPDVATTASDGDGTTAMTQRRKPSYATRARGPVALFRAPLTGCKKRKACTPVRSPWE